MHHSGGIPAWWLITIGVVVGLANGLPLIASNPTVQKVTNPLGITGLLIRMEAYPPWQSSQTKRFGRILACSVATLSLAWGIVEALANNEAFVRSLVHLYQQ